MKFFKQSTELFEAVPLSEGGEPEHLHGPSRELMLLELEQCTVDPCSGALYELCHFGGFDTLMPSHILALLRVRSSKKQPPHALLRVNACVMTVKSKMYKLS